MCHAYNLVNAEGKHTVINDTDLMSIFCLTKTASFIFPSKAFFIGYPLFSRPHKRKTVLPLPA